MYDRLKGFQDFYPAEMAARRAMFETLEATARELKDGALAGYAARVPQAEGN